MPAYPGTEENSWWTAVGCTLLAIASVSSETAQGILPDDFTSHVLGSLADGDLSGIHVKLEFLDHLMTISPKNTSVIRFGRINGKGEICQACDQS